MQSDFPCWLKGKDKIIAQALLDNGFWYAGKAEDFAIAEPLIKLEGWVVSSCCGEIAIDCVRDGALFCRDIDREDFDRAFLETKVAISAGAAKWKKSIGNQMELPL